MFLLTCFGLPCLLWPLKLEMILHVSGGLEMNLILTFIYYDSILRQNTSPLQVCKIFHSLHVHCMHRVCTHLENPWNLRISGVLFQGLEITWNWFFVLESPWFFIEQDWKILMFISFKWNESQWKQLFMTGNQSIKFLKCFETCTQGPLVTFVHVHWATSA